MKVIFLDIDGVLNADCDFGGKSKPNPYVTTEWGNRYCGICQTHVRELKKIVDRTGAKIVLVSSWKYDYNEYLRHGFENRVGKYLHNKLHKFGLTILDTTISYDFSEGRNRGYEIQQWLADHKEVDHWVVLDDEKFKDYDFLKITPNLVQTDPKFGLWTLPALQAIYKLTGEKDPWLEAHEKCAKLFSEIVEVVIPKVEEQDLTIIKPKSEEE